MLVLTSGTIKHQFPSVINDPKYLNHCDHPFLTWFLIYLEAFLEEDIMKTKVVSYDDWKPQEPSETCQEPPVLHNPIKQKQLKASV